VSKFFGIAAGFLLACLPAAAQTQQPIRVNCGGTNYTDSDGQVWQADTGFNTGTASANTAVTIGTSDPALYQTYRYNQNTTPLTYSFAVANGSYRVNLLFAENSTPQQAVAARVFNVKLNNNLVLQNFDIFAAVGANVAVVEGFNTTVTNGALAIEFDRLDLSRRHCGRWLAALRDFHFAAHARRKRSTRQRSGDLRVGIFAQCSWPDRADASSSKSDRRNWNNGLAGLDGTESSQRGLVLGAEFHTERCLGKTLKFSQRRSKVAAASRGDLPF
jgi:hypothetical protein